MYRIIFIILILFGCSSNDQLNDDYIKVNEYIIDLISCDGHIIQSWITKNYRINDAGGYTFYPEKSNEKVVVDGTVIIRNTTYITNDISKK